MSPSRRDPDLQTPGPKMHTAFCTCGWWDLFKTARDAQSAIDTHRNVTHHWDMAIRPPRGEGHPRRMR